MSQTLEQVRWDWERGGAQPLVVMDQISAHGRVLVVLQAPRRRTTDPVTYHCHRYFTIGDGWVCSADGQSVPLEAVWSWLNDPDAATTQLNNRIIPERVEQPA